MFRPIFLALLAGCTQWPDTTVIGENASELEAHAERLWLEAGVSVEFSYQVVILPREHFGEQCPPADHGTARTVGCAGDNGFVFIASEATAKPQKTVHELGHLLRARLGRGASAVDDHLDCGPGERTGTDYMCLFGIEEDIPVSERDATFVAGKK